MIQNFTSRLPWAFTLSAVLAMAAVAPSLLSADPLPGEVDLSFDPGSAIEEPVRAIARQSDGQWIVAGSGSVVRLNPDGSPDDSFAAAAVNGNIGALAVQPDDRIVIGGGFSEVGGEERNRIARLNADGSLDEDFGDGHDGVVGGVSSVVVQMDGQILIAGEFTSVNGAERVSIARLNSDGTVDPSFGSPLAAGYRVSSLALRSDGKIVLAAGGAETNEVHRINTDGTLDPDFNSGAAGGAGTITRIVVQHDDAILLGGMFGTINDAGRTHIARLQADGALDDAFVSSAAQNYHAVTAIAVQPDGRILIGMSSSFDGAHAVARLRHDGSVDPTFREGLNGLDGGVSVIAPQPDEKTVIGGSFLSIDEHPRMRVARLHGGSVDEPPSDILLSNAIIEENQPLGSEVGAFTAVDPMEHGPHSFTLVSGDGDDDNGSFSIADDALLTATTFDPAVQDTYNIRVRVTNPIELSFEKAFTLAVNANEAPTDIDLTGTTLFDKQPTETLIGNFSAADSDRHDIHTFELVAGDGDEGNDFFEIDGDQLVSAVVFDHSEETHYSIRVRATDTGGLSVTRTFAITVLPVGPGALDQFYRAAGGIDGAVRAVLRQEDGGWIVGGEFTTVDGSPRGSVARLNADGSLDDSFLADAEGADGPVHALALQNDGKIVIGGEFSSFNGEPRGGVARLHADGTLDTGFADPGVAGGAVYAVAVQRSGHVIAGGDFASAGGEPRPRLARLNEDGSLDAAFGDGGEGANGTVRSIAVERNADFLVAGDFTEIHGQDHGRLARFRDDGNLADALAHQWLGPVFDIAILLDDKILLAASSAEPIRDKVVRLHPDGSFDHGFSGDLHGPGEVRSLALQSDGKILVGGSFTSLSGIPRDRIARLNPGGTVDSTFGEESSGANGDVFAVAARVDGQVLIAGEFTEVNGVERDRIALLHGEGTPANQPPADIFLTNTSAQEEEPPGTLVGFLVALDPDPWDTHTFEFAGGEGDEGNALFTIEEDELRTTASLDFVEAASHNIRVRATDPGGLSVEAVLTVDVLPDPAPRDISLSNNVVFENRPVGTEVGTLTGVGRDPSQTHTFALVSGEGDDNNASFTIDGDSLQTAVVFSHEDASDLSVRIRVTNTIGHSLDRTFAIAVEPNQPPSDILLSETAFSENAPAGTPVAYLTAVDPDPNNTHTFSLADGEGDAGNSAFTIDSDRLIAAAAFDYQAQDTYSIRLRATSTDDLSVEKTFALTLISNQPPTGIRLSSQTVSEGRPAGTMVGGFFAVDPDEFDVHAFALANGEGDEGNDFFTVEGTALKTNAQFDASAQSVFSIRVRATDLRGESVEEVFAIHVAPRLASGNLPAKLDPAFAFAGADDDVRAIAVQEDGKILIGGFFGTVDGETRNRLARLHPDGSLDTDFPDPGIDRDDNFLSYVSAIAVQEDGGIVIAGSFDVVHGEQRRNLARLNPDGTLDTDFGGDSAGADATVRALAIQDDGGILVGGGFTEINGVDRNGIARLNPDGSVDLSFGHGLDGVGKSWDFDGYEIQGWVGAIAIHPDNRILIGGEFISVNGVPQNRVARLHHDGSVDASFDATEGPARGSAYSMALLNDGKILIGAYPITGLERLHSDGSIDTGFTPPEMERFSWLRTIAVQGDGHILIGGDLNDLDGGETKHLARLAPDGALDPGFDFGLEGPNDSVNAITLQDDGGILIGGWFTSVNGTPTHHFARLHGGYASPEIFAPTDILLSNETVPENWPVGTEVGTLSAVSPIDEETYTFALVEGDGDAGNSSFTIDGDTLKTAAVLEHDVQDSYSIRVRATDSGNLSVEKIFVISIESPPPPLPMPGVVDPDFDPNLSVNNTVYASVRQNDGRWIIGGSFTSVNGQPKNHIARLHADGTVDDTFMNGLAGVNGWVRAIAVEEDGKILIGGGFTTVHGETRNHIARLNTDGSLDTTFGDNVSGASGTVRSLAVQEDDKILIGGIFATVNGETRNRVARLKPDGSLDATFGNVFDEEDSALSISAIRVQTDGKILVGGHFTQVNSINRGFIARLNPDGSLDDTFMDGMAGANNWISAMEVQADGKILIGGGFSAVNETDRRGIARLNPDGSLDETFGKGLNGAHAVLAVTLQDDGKILIGGRFTTVNGTTRSRIARLNEDGTLDPDFTASADDWVYSITLQRDEPRILIGGMFTSVNGVPRERVALLLGGDIPENRPPTNITLSRDAVMDGQPAGTSVGNFAAVDPDADDIHFFALVSGDGDDDNAFFTIDGDTLKTAAVLDLETQSDYSIRVRATDSGGLFVTKTFSITVYRTPGDEPGDVDLTFDPGSIAGPVTAIARQTDGKWIIGGSFTGIDGEHRGRIARLNEDGTLDHSFGDGLAGANGYVSGVAVNEDGAIVLVGNFSAVNEHPRTRIARLHPDGSLDENFQAWMTWHTGPATVVTQSDGKILVGGYVLTVNGEDFNGVARLNEDGSLDSEFISPSTSDTWNVKSLAVQEDGKILMAGLSRAVTGGLTERNIARLNPDGTFDSTFEQIPVSGTIESVALQHDGRILIGGWFNTVDEQPRNRIARLNADGTLDHSFGDGLAGVDSARSPRVLSITEQPNGQVIIGGGFTSVDGEPRNGIARLNNDGSLDESFGAGLSGASGWVYVVASRGLDVLAGGTFTTMNDIPREYVALLQGGNLPPTDIAISHNTVQENSRIGTLVATFSAADPDADELHTFAFASGEGDDGNPFFTIEGNELRTAAVFEADEQDIYTVRIRAANTKDLWIERTFTITVTENAYHAWAEVLPEGEQDEDDDPGGLGIPNILRYAFGMDPLQPEWEKLPRVGRFFDAAETESPQALSESGEDSMYLTLTYTRRIDDPALLYIVESSGNLEDWLSFEGVEDVTDDGNDKTETVTVINTEPMTDSDKEFLRVRAER